MTPGPDDGDRTVFRPNPGGRRPPSPPRAPTPSGPTPPPQIRAITDHVYFFLDRKSPLWPEFSIASSIGMHFSGDWPELELELWAILEDRR